MKKPGSMKPGRGTHERAQGKPPGSTMMNKSMKAEPAKADLPTRRKAPTQRQKL